VVATFPEPVPNNPQFRWYYMTIGAFMNCEAPNRDRDLHFRLRRSHAVPSYLVLSGTLSFFTVAGVAQFVLIPPHTQQLGSKNGSRLDCWKTPATRRWLRSAASAQNVMTDAPSPLPAAFGRPRTTVPASFIRDAKEQALAYVYLRG
jgi:hypothetical protein